MAIMLDCPCCGQRLRREEERCEEGAQFGTYFVTSGGGDVDPFDGAKKEVLADQPTLQKRALAKMRQSPNHSFVAEEEPEPVSRLAHPGRRHRALMPRRGRMARPFRRR